MSIFEAAASAIGELVAYVIGRAVGRTFHLSPKRALVIGEYVVIGHSLALWFSLLFFTHSTRRVRSAHRRVLAIPIKELASSGELVRKAHPTWLP